MSKKTVITINLIALLAGAVSYSAYSDPVPYKTEDIYKKYPLLFNEYDHILADYPGVKYLYPGSFSIDAEDNVYIQYVFEPKQKDNVLVCYNSSGKYKGYYRIPSGGKGGGGEGVVVTTNELNMKSIYVVSNYGALQKYNMDSRFYGDELVKEQDFPVNVYNQFSVNEKYWLIESHVGERNISSTRNKLKVYSRNFRLEKDIELPMMYSGYIVSDATSDAKDYNKRQGVALGADFFVASYGGFFFPKMQSTANTYQGVRLFDLNGRMQWERIFKPNEMIKNLKQLGLSVSRIENEGVVVKGNIIYSMYIYSDRLHKNVSQHEGIIILKDQAKSLKSGD